MEAGADFIKTSRKKTNPAATPRSSICDVQNQNIIKNTGKKWVLKRPEEFQPEDAVKYYCIVKEILEKNG